MIPWAFGEVEGEHSVPIVCVLPADVWPYAMIDPAERNAANIVRQASPARCVVSGVVKSQACTIFSVAESQQSRMQIQEASGTQQKSELLQADSSSERLNLWCGLKHR